MGRCKNKYYTVSASDYRNLTSSCSFNFLRPEASLFSHCKGEGQSQAPCDTFQSLLWVDEQPLFSLSCLCPFRFSSESECHVVCVNFLNTLRYKINTVFVCHSCFSWKTVSMKFKLLVSIKNSRWVLRNSSFNNAHGVRTKQAFSTWEINRNLPWWIIQITARKTGVRQQGGFPPFESFPEHFSVDVWLQALPSTHFLQNLKQIYYFCPF